MKIARNFLGVLSPSTMAVAYPQAGDPPPYSSVFPGAVLGLATLTLSKKHPFLAFLAGDAVGGNAYRMWRGQGDDRRRVFGNLAVTAAIIGGSLKWKQHPFFGGVIGFGVGVLATSFVRGTLARRLVFGDRG
jgi:hypothetical protein